MTQRAAVDRLQSRLERLRLLAADGYLAAVLRTRQEIWRHGGEPEQVRIRHDFVWNRNSPPHGKYGDGNLPPDEERPAVARLLSPNGSAVQLELVALFEAQCTTPAGQAPRNDRPLQRVDPATTGWLDLVALPAEHSATGGRTAANTAQSKRLRQLKSTLDRLARSDAALIRLPHGARRRGKFENFELLHEAGEVGRPTVIAYTVPTNDERCVSIPASFFMNGWDAALTDAEIQAWLVLRHLSDSGSRTRVELEPWTRVERYGMGRDCYDSFKLLRDVGLLEIERAPERRDDGTWEGVQDGAVPERDRYTLRDEVLSEPGHERVREIVGRRLLKLASRGRR